MMDTQTPAEMAKPTILHDWFVDRLEKMEDSTLYFKGAWKNQIMFIRDQLSPAFGRDSKTLVFGTHTSKSTELPVYVLPTSLGTIELRGNYHDYEVCVELFQPLYNWNNAPTRPARFFQGMTRQFKNPWTSGVRTFSFEVWNAYELYHTLMSLKAAVEADTKEHPQQDNSFTLYTVCTPEELAMAMATTDKNPSEIHPFADKLCMINAKSWRGPIALAMIWPKGDEWEALLEPYKKYINRWLESQES